MLHAPEDTLYKGPPNNEVLYRKPLIIKSHALMLRWKTSDQKALQLLVISLKQQRIFSIINQKIPSEFLVRPQRQAWTPVDGHTKFTLKRDKPCVYQRKLYVKRITSWWIHYNLSQAQGTTPKYDHF